MKPCPWAAQHPDRDRLHQLQGAWASSRCWIKRKFYLRNVRTREVVAYPWGWGEGGGSHGIQVPHSPSQIWFSTPDKYIFSPRPNPPQRGQPRWHLPVTYFPLGPSDPSHLLGWRREGKKWVGGKQVNGELGARSEFQGNTQVVPSL